MSLRQKVTPWFLAFVVLVFATGVGTGLLVARYVPGVATVSYTHLDVYKRQTQPGRRGCSSSTGCAGKTRSPTPYRACRAHASSCSTLPTWCV